MSNYVIWSDTTGNYECSLTDFRGLDKTFPLVAGRTLAATFPADASFSMDPADPDNTLLSDSLSNTNRVIVASQRLTDFFKESEVPCLEYLPVTIYDHKGKTIDERYTILHPVDPVDCLLLDGVEVEYSRILKEQISDLDKILLDEERIPTDRVFFRCLNFNKVILVSRNFSKAISQSSFTGFEWLELNEYS